MSVIRVTPVIAPGLFAVNDIVGGKLNLNNEMVLGAGRAHLDSLILVDKAKQNAGLEIFVFSGPLAGTYADNTAEAVTAADWLKLLGIIDILSADYKTMANAAVVAVSGLSLPTEATVGEDNLWALIRTSATPTYTADCLQLSFGFRRKGL